MLGIRLLQNRCISRVVLFRNIIDAYIGFNLVRGEA